MLYENSGGIPTHYADKYSVCTAISQRYPVKTTIARDDIDPRLPFFMANDNINVNARVMNSKYVRSKRKRSAFASRQIDGLHTRVNGPTLPERCTRREKSSQANGEG